MDYTIDAQLRQALSECRDALTEARSREGAPAAEMDKAFELCRVRAAGWNTDGINAGSVQDTENKKSILDFIAGITEKLRQWSTLSSARMAGMEWDTQLQQAPAPLSPSAMAEALLERLEADGIRFSVLTDSHIAVLDADRLSDADARAIKQMRKDFAAVWRRKHNIRVI